MGREKRIVCESCGYELNGLVRAVDRCPECGHTIDWTRSEVSLRKNVALVQALIVAPPLLSGGLMVVGSHASGWIAGWAPFGALACWVVGVYTSVIALDLVLPETLRMRSALTILGGMAIGLVTTPVVIAILGAFELIARWP